MLGGRLCGDINPNLPPVPVFNKLNEFWVIAD
jgi:hypothetical protein